MNASLLRIRIAVLWVATAVAASAALLLYFVVPGAVEDLAVGEMEGEALTDLPGWMFAGLIGIAIVMSAVTLLVTERWGHYANAVVGALLGLFATFGVISHLSLGEFNGHVLMAMVAGLLAFLVVGISTVELRHPTEPQDVGDVPRPTRHRVGTKV